LKPTWTDDKLCVWALPLLSSTPATRLLDGKGNRTNKRSYHEIDDENQNDHNTSEPCATSAKLIVKQMFDSNWRYDALTSKPLSEVQMPATVYMRDPQTNQLIQYTGPLPGGKEPVPDITVLVREPWPGAKSEPLPSTKAAEVSISYIIRNHPQRSRFMPGKAKELNVKEGPLWSQLSNGFTVQSIDGQDVTPDMVLQPGKQGGGFAIIDLPTLDYVESLIARSEWRTANIMEGVGAMIWILGPGVTIDPRLCKFQKDMSDLEHIVSSPDCCPDTLALESAVIPVLRHNYVDSKMFPKLATLPFGPQHLDSKPSTGSTTDLPGKNVPAQRGLTLSLEPKLELEYGKIVPPLDLQKLESETREEIESITRLVSEPLSELSSTNNLEWQNDVPYGETEILTLGTGSSKPSTHRNVSGTLVRVPGCGSYLLDAGEGTMGTLKRMYSASELDAVLKDLKMIWISHMHADHHLGLTSVLKAWYLAVHSGVPATAESPVDLSQQSLAVISDAPMLHWLHEYSDVEDFGYSRLLPLATKPVYDAAQEYHDPQQSSALRLLPSTARTKKTSFTTTDYLHHLNLTTLASVFVSHCHGAQAVALTFPSGLKISYSGDCRPSADFAAIGRGSHVLIHEATFEDDMRGEAIAKKHSTAGEALVVATKMEAKAVVLTHFSQRYPTMPPLLDARPGEDQRPSPPPQHICPQPPDVLGEDAVSEDTPEELTPSIPTTTTTTNGQRKTPRPHSDKQFFAAYNHLITIGHINLHAMKVVSAFDYMRVKVADLPLLERKQPLLRAIYDGLAREDATGVEEESREGEGEGKEKKEKVGKKAKAKEQREKAEEKKARKRLVREMTEEKARSKRATTQIWERSWGDGSGLTGGRERDAGSGDGGRGP